jgi:DNA invertase Pin-like site-specific DNA recombinase
MVTKPTTADAYIRVSRVAGREGESFIAPDVQRKKIADWAALHNVKIVQWWEELDQSGAKRERAKFQEALVRCDRGATGGIVVARLDRFARSAVDALESIKRLNEAGARLVSVEDNFDGSTAMGRFAIGILTLIAELELERIKESWSTAVTEAVKRGVHISARAPAGYRRDSESGRLIPEEPAASAIAEVFRRRAVGASWTELARFLEDKGVYPVTGNPHWSPSGVANLVKNPVYLGQARSGSIVNNDAHAPIVTQAEFDAAQGGTTLLKSAKNSLSAQTLLKGLIRCAGCGHTLKISGSYDKKTKSRYPTYYCIGRYAKGHCTSRATIRASVVDRHVEEQVLTALQAEGGPLAQAIEASEQIEEAARKVTAAEHELDLFVMSPQLLTTIGQEKFMQGVDARQRALDDARQDLDALRSPSALASELPSGDLLAAWPDLTLQEKRRLLHGLLERVELSRSAGRGAKATPVAERTQIVLRGNVVLGSDGDSAAS